MACQEPGSKHLDVLITQCLYDHVGHVIADMLSKRVWLEICVVCMNANNEMEAKSCPSRQHVALQAIRQACPM